MTIRIKNLVIRASGIGKSEASEIGRGLTRNLTTEGARRLEGSEKISIRVKGEPGDSISAKAISQEFSKRI